VQASHFIVHTVAAIVENKSASTGVVLARTGRKTWTETLVLDLPTQAQQRGQTEAEQRKAGRLGDHFQAAETGAGPGGG
jgi:hypothetical protein